MHEAKNIHSKDENELTQARLALARGELSVVRQRCEALLSNNPQGVDALVLLGIAEAKSDSLAVAIHHLYSAVKLDPTRILAFQWLALTLRRAGLFDQGRRCALKALELDPSSADTSSNLGLCNLGLWQFDEAEKAFREAVRLDPRLAAAQHNLGVSLERLGRGTEAEAHYRKALEIEPGSVNSLVSLAHLLNGFGRSAEAESLFEKAERTAGSDPKQLRRLAEALLADNYLARAEVALQKALQVSPTEPWALQMQAGVLRQLGRFQDAQALYEQLLRQQPDSVEAYYNLVYGRRLTQRDRTLMVDLEKLSEPAIRTPLELAQIQYALGKGHDDLSEFEEASMHFKQANSLMRDQLEGMQFDASGFSRNVDRIIERFDPSFFKRNAGIGNPSSRPIFIVGMIRSGSTLLEQILSSHSQVGSAGELHYFLQNGALLSGSDEISSSAAGSVAENFLRLLDSMTQKERAIDKMPTNFLMLGVISTLFPNAKVIHCRRNAADNCLSIFVTPYGKPINYAHSPYEIVQFFRGYTRLMAHWRSVLPESHFYEVNYEDVVDAPNAKIREILGFLELEWEDSCSEFYKRGQAVLTPSNWQVRQPLYKRSVGRWQHYAPWFPEFRDL